MQYPSPQALARLLAGAINEDAIDADEPAVQGAWATSFEAAGVLTADSGFVVTYPDGRQFQVTVVQSS
jgi:hypothetical protein